NKNQIPQFINKVKMALKTKDGQGPELKGKKLAVLGLAFKPDTDDMREAPSVRIISELIALGAQVTAYDPKSMDNAKQILPDIDYAKNALDAIKDKDALLLVTEWSEFKELDLAKVKALLKNPVIIDGRNIYDKEKAKSLGFAYYGVGRLKKKKSCRLLK
ncbi:UDP-glucose/GDP-mannose dehydrogenase family protein, partial [Candidatus Curtissbacteria bacterium]|nr:UDP-glucose/GDP-mannose dehydrogenase family protein [Candidatus Curtissbacteria bacterium]